MTDDASKAARAYKISQRLRELSDAAPVFTADEIGSADSGVLEDHGTERGVDSAGPEQEDHLDGTR